MERVDEVKSEGEANGPTLLHANIRNSPPADTPLSACCCYLLDVPGTKRFNGTHQACHLGCDLRVSSRGAMCQHANYFEGSVQGKDRYLSFTDRLHT